MEEPQEAFILRNGLVARSDGWTDLRFSLTTGFLHGFTDNRGNKFIHVNKKDFRNDDATFLPAGFYPETSFLRYLTTDDPKYADPNSEYGKVYGYTNAKDGDVITVKKLDITVDEFSPFQNIFEFIYSSTVQYINFQGNSSLVSSIITPDNAAISVQPIAISGTAVTFYELNALDFIRNSTVLDDLEKREAAISLAKSAIVINHIIERIFPLFPDEPLFNEIIQSQKNNWELDNVFINPDPTVVDFDAYFEKIFLFYQTARRASYGIQIAENSEKLFRLTAFMSSKALSILSLENRKSIITYLIENELSTSREVPDAENLVLKLVNSFFDNAKNSDFATIDDFLGWLVSTRRYLGITGFMSSASYETYYQILYNSMSADLSLTLSLQTLSNWVLGTNFEPTTTREKFVQDLYTLWTNSKYNPYNELKLIKPNTIGFKTLNPDRASFVQADPEPGISNAYLFEYSHYPGYESYPSSQVQDCADHPEFCTVSRFFRETAYKDEAAPIAIPYESEKFIGIFFDNFRFSFFNNKIRAFELDKPVDYKAPEDSNDPDDEGKLIKEALLFGTYDIYQPVTLLNVDQDTTVPIVTEVGLPQEINGTTINSFIPCFVLAHIDRAGDRRDTEKVVGFAVEGVLTLSGIGNLAKLRHLRWFGGSSSLLSINGFRALIGGIEFPVGVINFLGNFVECNDNDETCRNIKALLVGLELAAGSLDAFDSLAALTARNRARNVVRTTGGTNTTERVQNLRDKLLDLNNGGSTTDAEDTASSIVAVARIEDIASEYAAFVASFDGFPNIQTKLEALRASDETVAFAFFQDLQKSDEVSVILRENDGFIDNISDLATARRVARILNIFRGVKKRVNQEVVSPLGGRGFSFNRWDRSPTADKKGRFTYTDSNQRWLTDDEIYGMIEYGLDLDPAIDDEWIEGIVTKAFRVNKPKTLVDIRGDGNTNIGELGIASQLGNRIPPPSGLLYSFTNLAQYEQFVDVIKTNYVQKYNLGDKISSLLIGGSVHTKLDPPDLDIVSYLSQNQLTRLYLQSVETANNARRLGIWDRDDYFEFIDYLDDAYFFQDRIYASQILTIENGQVRRMSTEVFNPNVSQLLNELNLSKKLRNKLDFVFFTEKQRDAGRSIPPETIIPIN